MKYPRYTREQNLACKLNDKDIDFIREHYIKGDKKWGQRALAKMFGIIHKSICYWVDNNKRMEFLQLVKEYQKINGSKPTSKVLQIRKMALMMPEIREYERIKQLKFNKNNPGYYKKYRSSNHSPYDSVRYRYYYERNRGKILARAKERYYRKYNSDPIFRQNKLERSRRRYELKKMRELVGRVR